LKIDGTIQKTTKLDLPQLLQFSRFSFKFFLFNGKYYEQIFDSPMGSHLSPILADVIMEDLETQNLQKLDFEVHTYYRYVNDVFMIISKTKLDMVLKIFNSYHQRLKFTYELETNNSLNFLNTLVIRERRNLITNWYRKFTFSRYINFFSNYPN